MKEITKIYDPVGEKLFIIAVLANGISIGLGISIFLDYFATR